MTRLLRALFLPASLLVIVQAALVVPLPVLLEEPGDPFPLAGRVSVGGGDDTVDGDYLVTTVLLRRATVATAAAALVEGDVDLLAQGTVVPHGQTYGGFFRSQRSVFRIAARIAAAAGLDAAGFAVAHHDVGGHGARVSSVVAGSPADGVLRPGDVVVAADGAPVRLPQDLQDAVAATPGGHRLRLSLLRGGARRTVELAPRRLPVAPVPVLGVAVRTHRAHIDLPVPVRVEPGQAGGPSAGLVIALTVYDKAERAVDLAGGRRVAATGTIDVRGDVGVIGGVEQKVVAATRADADVLLVPAEQEDEAVAALPAGGDLRVVGVGTLHEAIHELRRRETVGRLLG